uniref:Transposase-associated domain-containing protein n=1 Tax=Cajanus cajan TaxID=3821 RepID=A0A151SX51_CAJCA|nr:hypothetical protein KK1_014806 [Cajanus cajan]
MDKSWIDFPRKTLQYMEGLNKFLDFAFSNKSVDGKIICPCLKCKFNKWQTREATYEHSILKPFPKGYTFWLLHGETRSVQNVVETPPIPQQNEDRVVADNPIYELKFLAMGPIDCAKRFSAYNVNGFKFRTLERDEGLKTQNRGILGTFGTRSYASSSDNQMQFGGVPYYGKLIDIIEINYHGRFSVTLFKCMWANTTISRGIVTDDLGFTSVNFARLIHTGDNDDDEPYIQATEAQMVYYVEDESDKNWSIPVHLKPRDLYDMGEDDGDTFHECEPFEQQNLENSFPDGEENIPLTRFYF